MIQKLTYEQINRRHQTFRPARRHPVSILLENVRSAYNVGSVLRTADAGYLENVYCAGITATPNHRSVAKTALGAQESVPWQKVSDAVELARHLRSNGIHLAALEQTKEPASWGELHAGHFPLCLVVGNEISGVSDALLRECDVALEIVQYGEKQSLNVSVAAGIAVYRLLDRLHSGL